MKLSRLLFIAGTLLVITSCSLEAKKGPSLSLRVDFDSENSPSPFIFADPIRAFTAPNTVNGFACLGVNIMGPGIPDSSTNPEGSPDQIFAGLQQGSRCSYRGIVAGPFYKDAVTNAYVSIDTTLKIPSGSTRMIQVLGTTDTLACSTQFQQDTPNSGTTFYELARTFLPSVFSDRSETLTTNWNSLTAADQEARAMDCGNNGSSCSLQYQYANFDTTHMTSASSKIAFRFTVPLGGAYIHSLKLRLSAGTLQNVPLSIYPDLAGIPDTAASVVGSSQFTGVQTAADYSANFGSGNGIWIPAASATDYWIVMAPTGVVDVHQDGMATTEPTRIKDFTSVWTGHSSGLPRHEIRVCGS